MTSRDELELIESVYSASMEPSLWPNFARNLGRKIQATTVHIAIIPAGSSPYALCGTGLDDAAVRSYAHHFIHSDPVTPKILRRFGLRRFATEEAVISADLLLRTEFHNDWARPNGLRHCLVAKLANCESYQAILSLGRSEREGSFLDSERELSSFSRLLPHLGRAVEIQIQLCAAGLRRDTALAVLDLLPQGILLLNSASQVLFSNRACDKLFSNGGAIRMLGNQLVCAEPARAQNLHRLVAQASDPTTSGVPSGSLLLDRPSGAPLSLLISPVRIRPNWDASRRGTVMVIVSDPDARPVSAEHLWASTYHLTKAESRVAGLIVAGLTVNQIAMSLGVRPGTVRNQLKQVFQKTDSHRQVDLIRLLTVPMA